MRNFKFVVRYPSGRSLTINIEAENAERAEELCAARMGRGEFVTRLDCETGKLYTFEQLTDRWVWFA